MDISKFWPFLLVTLAVQATIQIYLVIDCLKNPAADKRKKIFFILALLIFNYPAGAFYLFSMNKATGDIRYMVRGISVLSLFSFIAFSVNLLFRPPEDIYGLLVLFLTLGLFLFFIAILSWEKDFNKTSRIMSLILIILVSGSNYLSGDINSLLLFLSITALFVNIHTRHIALAFGALSLGSYIISEILRSLFIEPVTDFDAYIGPFYINLIIFVLVFLSVYNLKKQQKTNRDLETAMERLKLQAAQIEKMSASQERNRIAGEIHDNAGHELTSAVISIESGIKALEEGKEGALETFIMTREIIKKSLREIRKAVRAIHDEQKEDFYTALNQLKKSTSESTGMNISILRQTDAVLLPIQSKILLGAVKECLTNSLRHGKSTSADILLSEHMNNFIVSVTDNGTGTDNYKTGMGLALMKTRVESIGGSLNIFSEKGEGFSVIMNLRDCK